MRHERLVDMTEKLIEDIKLVLQGDSKYPVVNVSGYEDKNYQFLYKLAKDINPKTEDNMYSVSRQVDKLLTTLRYMEEYDYDSMVRKIKGYC